MHLVPEKRGTVSRPVFRRGICQGAHGLHIAGPNHVSDGVFEAGPLFCNSCLNYFLSWRPQSTPAGKIQQWLTLR